MSGFFWDLQSPCFYTFYGDFKYGLTNQIIEIKVEYFFATEMYIGNGTDSVPDATGRVKATFPRTYNYSIMIGDFERNYVNVGFLPDL